MIILSLVTPVICLTTGGTAVSASTPNVTIGDNIGDGNNAQANAESVRIC